MKNTSAQATFAAVRDRPGAVWLDGGENSRSLVAWDPIDTVAGDVDFREAGRSLQTEGGVVIGMIGYGAGHHVESVPAEAATPEPAVWLGRYEHVRWFDSAPIEPVGAAVERASTTVSAQDYRAAVERIRDWIAAGDCYQVNLSRAVRVEGVEDPWSVYRRLRTNDAAYGAFLRLAEVAVLSNSPELLLHMDGRRLRSDPIKGTAPRSTGSEDAALAQGLLDSAKDHAELAMIVDLVRNDLGRVAVAGSVTTEGRRLTTHGNVHHTSWPVVAELRPELDVWDALASLFPPGSVTGAPKIRATQRIAELEWGPRGAYCGALGFVDGEQSCWSVAIRTAVWHRGALRYHVGGGITWDSDATAEVEETVHKGRAMAASVGAVEI